MLERFYPDEWVDSAYDIDYENFYREGKRAVLFDIDNTLVPHGAPADGRSRELMTRLREDGFGILFLSNNKEPRVRSFCEEVGLEGAYIYKAGKPAARSYRKAMELLGTEAPSTLFVGDQLFTDILGAKNAGIHTCLVKPIHPREEIQIVIKRFFERIVLHFYQRSLDREGKRR